MKTKLLTLFVAVLMLVACNKPTTTDKDMYTITFNEEQAAWMTAIAAFEAQGDIVRLESAINGGLDAGLTVSQIKEALSQLYAYTGFPRSLNALGTLQKVVESRKSKEKSNQSKEEKTKVESLISADETKHTGLSTLSEAVFSLSSKDERSGLLTIDGVDASPLPKDYDALKQGTEIQTKLSGRAFDYDFAPATDYYLKAHLFGDIFARDNLTYAERELVTVSALSGMTGVEPQLAAHIRGSRNMGVTEEQLQGIIVALAVKVGADEAGRAAKAYADMCASQMGDETRHGGENQQSDKTRQSHVSTLWDKGSSNTAYAQFFIGNSYLHPYADGVSNVTFEPACRNNWHIHHGAVQVLVCVSGRGWYQEWGKQAVEMTAGTVIRIPEGVKHWHGAAADSWFQHLAMHTEVQPINSNEWLEPVTDEQYNKLK